MIPAINQKLSKQDIKQLANNVVDNVCITGDIVALAENLSKMEFLKIYPRIL